MKSVRMGVIVPLKFSALIKAPSTRKRFSIGSYLLPVTLVLSTNMAFSVSRIGSSMPRRDWHINP